MPDHRNISKPFWYCDRLVPLRQQFNGLLSITSVEELTRESKNSVESNSKIIDAVKELDS